MLVGQQGMLYDRRTHRIEPIPACYPDPHNCMGVTISMEQMTSRTRILTTLTIESPIDCP